PRVVHAVTHRRMTRLTPLSAGGSRERTPKRTVLRASVWPNPGRSSPVGGRRAYANRWQHRYAVRSASAPITLRNEASTAGRLLAASPAPIVTDRCWLSPRTGSLG